MKGISGVVIGVVLAIIGKSECQITGWTTPSGATGSVSAGFSGSVSINENTGPGDLSTQLVATTTGPATISTYSIVSQSVANVFRIQNDGDLHSCVTLDYESVPSYTVIVVVTDSASASATLTLTITVTDVNEAPMFSTLSGCVAIADAAAAGTTLTTVMATDPDTGDTITYSMGTGNTNTDFAVSSSGVVTTANAIDMGTTASYVVQVKAADNDGSPLTGTTTLTVCIGGCPGTSAASGVSAGILTLISGVLALVMH